MPALISFIQQHWMLSLAFVIILLTTITLEFIHQKRSALRISPTKATQLINKANAVVFDIRSTLLFKAGHIIDALSFPQLTEISKKFDKYKAQPIIIVCSTGTESAKTAALLIKHGFNANILAGGMRAWQDADMPIVKE